MVQFWCALIVGIWERYNDVHYDNDNEDIEDNYLYDAIDLHLWFWWCSCHSQWSNNCEKHLTLEEQWQTWWPLCTCRAAPLSKRLFGRQLSWNIVVRNTVFDDNTIIRCDNRQCFFLANMVLNGTSRKLRFKKVSPVTMQQNCWRCNDDGDDDHNLRMHTDNTKFN